MEIFQIACRLLEVIIKCLNLRCLRFRSKPLLHVGFPKIAVFLKLNMVTLMRKVFMSYMENTVLENLISRKNYYYRYVDNTTNDR